jgi:tetratricopeptide (TPR) repeat protein
LAEASKRKPSWSRIALCLGQIDELEGRRQDAIANYLRAIEQGDHQGDVLRRAIGLLYQQGRYAELEAMMRRLPQEPPLSNDLQRLGVQAALLNGRYDHALERAAKAVDSDSKDYRDHLLTGVTLWASLWREQEPVRRTATQARARKSLERAVELNPMAPEAWLSLVKFLKEEVGAAGEAQAAVAEAEKRLPAADATLALAQCYDAIDAVDKAKELFTAAIAARPKEMAVLRPAISFYLRRNDLAAAEQHLRAAVELGREDPGAAAWARPKLALVMASTGDYEHLQEALSLIGSAKDQSLEAQRIRSLVLAFRPGTKERLEAIDALERLNLQRALSPDDRFELVKLYDKVGDSKKAWERLLPLLESSGGNAAFVAYGVVGLIERQQLDKAEELLSKLATAQPDALRTSFLKARLLQARDRGPDAIELLSNAAKGKGARETATVAAWLESLGAEKEAEELYRRNVEQTTDPGAVLQLAQCIGRQKRTAEALDLCERTWEKSPPVLAAKVSMSILYDAAPDADEALTRGRVGQRLEATLKKYPDHPEFLLCRASLHELCGEYDAAVVDYRKVLDQDGRNAVAANNLAWILALRDGKGEEALALVDKAMRRLGPIPEILDTQATAYLAAGEYEAALKILGDASASADLDPKVRLSLGVHRTQAYLRSGRRADAERAWRACQELKLGVEALHPLERSEYERLIAEFSRP